MYYCSNCGKELDESCKFCSACGQPTANSTAVVEVTATDCAQDDEPKQAKCWSVFAKVSKILGIVAISISWLPILFGVFVGQFGIVFAILGNVGKDYQSQSNKRTGLILSIVASIVSIVSYVLLIAGTVALAML